jgi:hypothetical protein
MSKDEVVTGSRRAPQTISCLCLALVVAQLLFIVPHMYSGEKASAASVALFSGATLEALFGLMTLGHVLLLGRATLPAGYNRRSGAYTYVFFLLGPPISMVVAVVAGPSGSTESTVFGLQLICFVLMCVWMRAFQKLFAGPR